jgi:pimeloyl-ACP methyl ester carboxylesterase
MSTWVLLRGLTRETRHWGGFGGLLAERLGEIRVVAMDLPGSGLLNGERSPCHVDAMVDSCRAQLASLEIPQPWSLLGISLGAMVALHWSGAYPHEIARTVVINTSARGSGPFWKRMRPANYLRLAAMLAAPAAQRERHVLEMTANARHPGIVEQWTAIAQSAPVSALNAMRQLTAAARFSLPGTAPEVPLLVLASAGDALVSHHCSQRMANHWGAPLRLHPWAGHDLPLDDPAWVVEQIAQWIRQ